MAVNLINSEDLEWSFHLGTIEQSILGLFHYDVKPYALFVLVDF